MYCTQNEETRFATNYTLKYIPAFTGSHMMYKCLCWLSSNMLQILKIVLCTAKLTKTQPDPGTSTTGFAFIFCKFINGLNANQGWHSVTLKTHDEEAEDKMNRNAVCV